MTDLGLSLVGAPLIENRNIGGLTNGSILNTNGFNKGSNKNNTKEGINNMGGLTKGSI